MSFKVLQTSNIKRYLALIFVACLALQSGLGLAAEAQALVNDFWAGGNAAQQALARENLLRASDSTEQLYNWLKQGPEYSADVPTGELVFSRTASDGTEFPYMVFIPDSYDPLQQQAAEFVLHGGVGRPKPPAGDNFWQRSLDRVGNSERITVVPLSWAEEFWWQDSQADNLSAILNTLKASYNIDENRVTLSGISDGGTGAYFFAFKHSTPWAAFLPFIGHPGVLRNPNSGGGYRLYFENLMGKPLYIVNGENDRLYPSASLESFIGILQQENIDHTWRVIENGGHNLDWYPDAVEALDQFRAANSRDPFPEYLQWVTDRTDRYNRYHWIIADSIAEAERPSLLKVFRDGNRIEVEARGVETFTLLLNPEEVNFSEDIVVNINGTENFRGSVAQNSDTLLKWARQDLDRSMLVTAELTLTVSD